LVNYADANTGSQEKHNERMAKALSVTDPWKSKRHICRNSTIACALTFADRCVLLRRGALCAPQTDSWTSPAL
jgi:hypothetical protein